jgi:hypothetical protein
MCKNSIALILHQIRRWRARGRHARSWETIGRVVVVGGVGSTTVTQGVDRSGQGCRGRRCRGRGCGAGEGIPGRAPDRTGCEAAGRGMVTSIGRSALWRGVGPWAAAFRNPVPCAHCPDLPRSGLLLAALGSTWGRLLAAFGIPGRVPLTSSTIAALLRLFDALRHNGGLRAPTTAGPADRLAATLWRALTLLSAKLQRRQGDRVFGHYGR